MDAQPAQRGLGRAGQDQEQNESLTMTAGGLNRADNEATSLLSRGAGLPRDGRNANGEHEWEGTADFKGLSWRKTPSVCCRL